MDCVDQKLKKVVGVLLPLSQGAIPTKKLVKLFCPWPIKKNIKSDSRFIKDKKSLNAIEALWEPCDMGQFVINRKSDDKKKTMSIMKYLFA